MTRPTEAVPLRTSMSPTNSTATIDSSAAAAVIPRSRPRSSATRYSDLFIDSFCRDSRVYSPLDRPKTCTTDSECSCSSRLLISSDRRRRMARVARRTGRPLSNDTAAPEARIATSVSPIRWFSTVSTASVGTSTISATSPASRPRLTQVRSIDRSPMNRSSSPPRERPCTCAGVMPCRCAYICIRSRRTRSKPTFSATLNSHPRATA